MWKTTNQQEQAYLTKEEIKRDVSIDRTVGLEVQTETLHITEIILDQYHQKSKDIQETKEKERSIETQDEKKELNLTITGETVANQVTEIKAVKEINFPSGTIEAVKNRVTTDKITHVETQVSTDHQDQKINKIIEVNKLLTQPLGKHQKERVSFVNYLDIVLENVGKDREQNVDRE